MRCIRCDAEVTDGYKTCAECRRKVREWRRRRLELRGEAELEKEREWKRRWRKDNLQQARESEAKWRANNKDKIRAKTLRTQRDPVKMNAHSAVHYAVRVGNLVRPDACERCGVIPKRLEAHHHDYSKYLEVEWLCTPCHHNLHLAEVAE